MRIAVAVCDDLEEACLDQSRKIADYGVRRRVELTVETVLSGEELLTRWTPGRWDLVFLDVYMEGLDGVETARQLREREPGCSLILATTSMDHGLESFELEALDYLVKPFAQQDVDAAMDWFLRKRSSDLQMLSVAPEGGAGDVRLADILYVEMQRHTAAVHTLDGVYDLRKTMEILEQELADRRFYRCHRSYLVNLDWVRQMLRRDFEMENGDLVPVSAKRLAEARQAFLEWSLAKNWGR